ncbi:MAG TPA: choice-of-anchor Q domain-containing protein [Solirubrobacteraceae bacterium]|nr:choice-of-anchor Q domain-containing protein [Solirubrobacteraceae bacterium]
MTGRGRSARATVAGSRLALLATVGASAVGLLAWSTPPVHAEVFPAGCEGSTGDVKSLAAAIHSANALTGPDTIQLGSGCTYSLSAVDNYWYGPNGLPAIASDITIEGDRSTIIRAPTAPSFRLLFVGADPSRPDTDHLGGEGYVSPGAGLLTLRGLTLSGGWAKGGDSNGGGGGAGMGGAIFNQGSLTIERSTLTGNLAEGGSGEDPLAGRGGGGMGSGPAGYDAGGFGGELGPGLKAGVGGAGGFNGAGGGAGFRTGESGVAGSFAGPGAGGGPRTGLGGSNVGTNAALGGDGSGAGGYSGQEAGQGGNFGEGGLKSTIGSGGGGGGVGGGGAAGATGGAGGFGGGGGAGDQFTPGAGGFGGGGGSNVEGTMETGPPGFGGGTPEPNRGGGGAGMGGAIFNMQGTVVIASSTFAANTAVGGAGGVNDPGKGIGGAIFNLSGKLTASNSTFAGNSAAYFASQLFNLVYDGYQTRIASTALRDTIVANGLGGVDLAADETAYGLPEERGASIADVSQFNLVRTTLAMEQGLIMGSALGSPPALGPLADNGGPAQTIALLGGSPAIDAGDPGCDDLSGSPVGTDERGALRPAGGACDIGAFELAIPSASSEAADALTSTGASLHGLADNPDVAGGQGYFQYGTSSSYGSQTPAQELAALTRQAPLTAALAGLVPGTTYHFRAVVTNAAGTSFGADQTFATAAQTFATVVPEATIGKPQLSSLAETNSTFAAGRSSTPLSGRTARAVKTGTVFSFRLDQPAQLKVVVERQEHGRRVGHRCAPAHGAPAHGHGCRLWRTVLTLARTAKPAVNRLPFSGRVHGRALPPARYRARFSARDAAGSSAPQGIGFRIVRR